MSEHNSIRFSLAPPFSNVMCDLAQPFQTKTRWNSRQTFKTPALVTVCLITGAVSINMCENWTTESLMQALERHSSRYGLPSYIYVDSGSQMMKIKDVDFSIRDLTTQAVKRLNCTVIVAPPKSHSHQGRVERKILHIKDLLDRISEKSFLQSFLGWETTMCKVSNLINSLPICRPSGRSVSNFDFDVLTPNRMLMGFNNTRALSGPFVLDAPLSSLLKRSQEIENCCFDLLQKRVHLFIPRSKWFANDSIFTNDICLFFLDDSPMKARNTLWHYGRVIAVNGGRLQIEYSVGSSSKRILERSKRQIVRIASEEELNFNTHEHFDSIVRTSGYSNK